MLAVADDDFVVSEALKRIEAHAAAVLTEREMDEQSHSASPSVQLSADLVAVVIPPDLRAPIYDLAVRHGGTRARQLLRRLYQAATLSEEKIRLLRAIGYMQPTNATDAAQVAEAERKANEVLQFAFSPAVRVGDIVNVFVGLCSSKFGRNFAWNWITHNFHLLTDKFNKGSSFLIGGVLNAVISGFSSVEKAKEIQQYFAAHPCAPAERVIKQAIESIHIKVARRAREHGPLQAWLDRHKFAGIDDAASTPDNPHDGHVVADDTEAEVGVLLGRD